jgi:hypothetical protein
MSAAMRWRAGRADNREEFVRAGFRSGAAEPLGTIHARSALNRCGSPATLAKT